MVTVAGNEIKNHTIAWLIIWLAQRLDLDLK